LHACSYFLSADRFSRDSSNVKMTRMHTNGTGMKSTFNYAQSFTLNKVCELHNHVFYVVSIHEFFCTTGIRSNSLHSSSTSDLQSPQITNHFFFYGRTNHRSAAVAARRGELAGRRRRRRWSPVRKREGERYKNSMCFFYIKTHMYCIAFL